MDVHPTLTTVTYVGLIVFALLVIAYWVMYTRLLRTPLRVGTNEGIAIATERKERTGRTGTIDRAA
jgi:hypothetical protein